MLGILCVPFTFLRFRCPLIGFAVKVGKFGAGTATFRWLSLHKVPDFELAGARCRADPDVARRRVLIAVNLKLEEEVLKMINIGSSYNLP
ncbi:unnamed protein product [Haemonchus placei]|uniref:Secreted protein n=1 Tax=Haemonchus placei TaxID=6290 RepID=A0A0N4W6Z8_HAEPC|nr:unnamed protein product [Haemonchus placei]